MSESEGFLTQSISHLALAGTGVLSGIIAFTYVNQVPSLPVGFGIRGLVWSILFLTVGLQPTVFLVSDSVRVRLISSFIVLSTVIFLLTFLSSLAIDGFVETIVEQHGTRVLLTGVSFLGSIAISDFLNSPKRKIMGVDVILILILSSYIVGYLVLAIIKTRDSELIILVSAVFVLSWLTISSINDERTNEPDSSLKP